MLFLVLKRCFMKLFSVFSGANSQPKSKGIAFKSKLEFVCLHEKFIGLCLFWLRLIVRKNFDFRGSGVVGILY